MVSINTLMILSKKTRYAIVALTRLAREYGKGPIQIQGNCRSRKRFLRVFLKTFFLN